jgi:hypothetical protein
MYFTEVLGSTCTGELESTKTVKSRSATELRVICLTEEQRRILPHFLIQFAGLSNEKSKNCAEI